MKAEFPARFLFCGLFCGLFAGGCSRLDFAPEVPVATVSKQKFSRIVTADGQLRAVRASLVTVPPDADGPLRINFLATDGTVVKKDDILVRFDDLELHEHLANAQSDRASADAKKQKETVLYATAGQDWQRSIAAAQRDLRLSRDFPRRDSAIFTKDQIIESQVDERLQETRLRFSKHSAAVDRSLGKSKLGVVEVELQKAAEAIRRSQQGLNALLVKATHDGVFTLQRNSSGEAQRVGDTVWRGMTVGEVAFVDQLEAEVFVLEAEAADLAEGRKAEVMIQAHSERSFAGTIKTVEKVTKRRLRGSPTQYFGVVIRLEKTFPEIMKLGQRVQTRLFLREQESLLVQRPALFQRAGRWVVYRQESRGSFAAVPVELGAATAGLLAIESGLKAGDVIALRDPTKAAGEILAEPAKPTHSPKPAPRGR